MDYIFSVRDWLGESQLDKGSSRGRVPCLEGFSQEFFGEVSADGLCLINQWCIEIGFFHGLVIIGAIF